MKKTSLNGAERQLKGRRGKIKVDTMFMYEVLKNYILKRDLSPNITKVRKR